MTQPDDRVHKIRNREINIQTNAAYVQFWAGFLLLSVLSIDPVNQAGDSQLAKPKAKAAAKAIKKLTKGALIQAILESMGEGWVRKDVVKLLDSLTEIGHNELKKKGLFILPGFAKFVVVKKPARPARQGINPFTKEPTTFAAKPASKAVKARPIKAIKNAIA
jgi:DNA-binding protein HU-beta